MSKKEEMLTAEIARHWLAYDDEIGRLRWARSPCSALPVGRIAGALQRGPQGYRRVILLGRKYLEHRLVWLVVKGAWPAKSIDHIDRCRNNNRISNLRVADSYEQSGNTKVSAKNTSGFRGVVWHKRDKKWQASIRIKGRRSHLGQFDKLEDAANAYKTAAANTFGEFYKP